MNTAIQTIDEMLAAMLNNEGGYVNDPNDRGGETNHGITVAVARANGYTGDMRAMTRSQALDIYRSQYFVRPGFKAVFDVSPGIAAEMLDTGVNMGPKVAATFLQKCLNVLNRVQKDYGDILVDGDCGPTTIAALQAFLNKRGDEGESVLLKMLNCLQGARYIELALNREANETFVYGWIANRVSMSI